MRDEERGALWEDLLLFAARTDLPSAVGHAWSDWFEQTPGQSFVDIQVRIAHAIDTARSRHFASKVGEEKIFGVVFEGSGT